MQISKSDYMLYLRHPAWLWLKKHEPKKLPQIDAATQAIFDTGHLFEPYAESLYPGGVTLGFTDYPSYKTLPERTSQALESGVTTIFQGRFEFNELTFICDIIQVVGDRQLDLIEIKSSTGANKDHEYDLAFQQYVLEGCGYQVRSISVIHVNNKYVRSGEIDARQLTAVTDITDKVRARAEETAENVQQALIVAKLDSCPDMSPSLAKMGSFPDWVKVYSAVNNIEPFSIYDIQSIGVKKAGLLEEMGVSRIVDIPDDFVLNAKQTLQVKATKLGQPIIQKDKIKDWLDGLSYPLYFLDYETMSSLVPYFDGMQPYKQYPFQYSLHVIESPGSEIIHLEYLHTDNSNPMEALSKSLQANIGNKGSVITWNMGFEKSCNTTMGEQVPEFSEFYSSLNDRIVDLMIPFSSGWYADKGFKGSASIKAVLPVLVPELSYKELDIQEGASAQRTWMETILDGKNEADRQKIIEDLIKYCKLDTLAMVEIYKKLIRTAE
ncbi:DUF2779 domain-containing protein [Candidatus Saccharibacteria bacterium]|nr:DUF2779 domain-containing protein [Candidatus Saccharibacteria bacterium]